MRQRPWLLFTSIALCLTALFITPLLLRRLPGTFYSVDADVHYVGNALSYIERGQITYSNHPGTPVIVLYAYLLLPIRLYAKLIVHTNFIDWAILHPHQIYFYLRIVQSIIFAGGLSVFCLAIYRYTKSKFATLFGLALLCSFSFIPYLALYLRAEGPSVLLIGYWLYLFSQYLKKNDLKNLYIMAILAGLLVASKLTNSAYMMTVILLPFTRFESWKKYLTLSLKMLMISSGCFVIATSPIISRYPEFFRLATNLATHTEMMGEGKAAFFDLGQYLLSVKAMIMTEKLFLMSAVLCCFALCVRVRKSLPAQILFGIVVGIFTLAFAKYPWSYYQYANVMGLSYLVGIGITKLERVKYLLFIVVLSSAVLNIHLYLENIAHRLDIAKNLDDYVETHPASGRVMWDFAFGADYALLWGNEWSGQGYAPKLQALRPELSYLWDYENLNFTAKSGPRLFDQCWQRLYLRDSLLPAFQKTYGDRILTYQTTSFDGLVMIEQSSCQK